MPTLGTSKARKVICLIPSCGDDLKIGAERGEDLRKAGTPLLRDVEHAEAACRIVEAPRSGKLGWW